MNISSPNPLAGVSGMPAAGQSRAGGAGMGEFGKLLATHLENVNQTHAAADQAIQQLATGQTDNIHDVVLNMAKADLSFRLVLEIRNRLIESYQEIMRMQI